MDNFKKLDESSYSFSSCDICNAQCCDGSKNIVHSQITLENFEETAKYFPILFTFGELGYLMPIILLTNGKDFCQYIHNSRCTIYENRPSVCRAYPLSPHLSDEVYIDTACPAVSEIQNNSIPNNDIMYKKFETLSLTNYQDKYINTYRYFSPHNKPENLELAININGMNFYKFKNDLNLEYIKIHMQSLEHLSLEYFNKN